MNSDLWIGLALTLVAGLLSGNCMLPMKFVRRWAWENTWFVFSIVSLIVLPGLLALVLVRDLGSVYASLPASAFVAPLGYGAGWGIAQALFGLSVARLGMALGYAIIVGLGALLGTIVPLFVQHRAVTESSRGMLIFAGVFIMVVGIAVCAWAGRIREPRSSPVGSYPAAVLMAVICGLLAPMLNFSFAFGQPIAEAAVRMGTSPASAGYAVWAVALAGGFVPNLLYSIYLLNRNRTWKNFFRAALPDVWFGSSMAVLWMGAVSIYGVSSVFLGELGTSIGWGIFQIFMIMTANLSGVLTGEWKTAPAKARQLLAGGLVLLAAATVMMALGNR